MALYDPQQFPEAPATVSPDFTVADVLTWAKTKPADEIYNYQAPCMCALAQFLIETGRAGDPCVTNTGWSDGYDPTFVEIDLRVAAAARGRGKGLRQTFGQFAKRLEALS